MININSVVIGGRLCAPPELRYTAGGTAVGNMRVAINEKYKTSSGEVRDRATFVDVIVWGKIAESCAEYLDKGSELIVEGGLRTNEWEDRATGQKRQRLEVNAARVQFGNNTKRGNGVPAPAGVAAREHDPTNSDVPF